MVPSVGTKNQIGKVFPHWIVNGWQPKDAFNLVLKLYVHYIAGWPYVADHLNEGAAAVFLLSIVKKAAEHAVLCQNLTFWAFSTLLKESASFQSVSSATVDRMNLSTTSLNVSERTLQLCFWWWMGRWKRKILPSKRQCLLLMWPHLQKLRLQSKCLLLHFCDSVFASICHFHKVTTGL